jgi:altronate hydrolase
MESENPLYRLQLSEATVKLDPQDDVVVAKRDLSPGTVLIGTDAGEARELLLEGPVPSGHKLALRAISAGEPVHRYGQVIGFAKQDIQPGAHVHKQNLGMGDLTLDYAFGADARPVDLVPESDRRTFDGYRRANGQVGTRNYIAVVSTVSCSAYAARSIARYFTPERLAAYGNVDGVMAVTHLSGCSYVPDGPVYTLLQRSLAGMVRHPNVAASIIVGLGCEVNQLDALIENYDLAVGTGKPLHALVIQEIGGGRKTVQAGIEAIEALLPQANAMERRPQPISELMIALQCGGSDGWSGVTANPLVGKGAPSFWQRRRRSMAQSIF